MFFSPSLSLKKKRTSSKKHFPLPENQTLINSRCPLISAKSTQMQPTRPNIDSSNLLHSPAALALFPDPFVRLEELFMLLFSYQPLLVDDFARLRSHERSLFIFILRTKTYSQGLEMGALVRGRSRDVSACLRFCRSRRKEENLKFCFRLAIQILREAFNRRNLDLVKRFGSKNMELVFYLFHFSHLKSDSSFNEILSSLDQKKPFTNSNSRPFWALIRPFIFPEIVSKCAFSSTKSISKKFLFDLTRSHSFIAQIMHLLVNVTFFLCFCLSHNWSSSSQTAFDSPMVQTGVHVLRSLSRQNQRDLRRMLGEWGSKMNGLADLERIKKGIRRKNFSLPWTFIELRCSFLDTMLSLVEIFNIDLLKSSEEGAIVFII